MKPEEVKIVQFQIEPYEWYESNGSIYKTKKQDIKFWGMGDDGKIYRYGEHNIYAGRDVYPAYTKFNGWREYTPKV